MTRTTLQFLLNLVNMQQLNVGAPDFDDVVVQIVDARRELIDALSDTDGTQP
jgi:hypothetical protein